MPLRRFSAIEGKTYQVVLRGLHILTALLLGIRHQVGARMAVVWVRREARFRSSARFFCWLWRLLRHIAEGSKGML